MKVVVNTFGKRSGTWYGSSGHTIGGLANAFQDASILDGTTWNFMKR